MPLRIDPIHAATTALIVVDMQNHFLAPGAPLESPAGREMIPALARVIALCREHAIPVVYTRQLHREEQSGRRISDHFWPGGAERGGLVDGTPGAELHADIAPQQGDVVVDKYRYSAFFRTDLELMLRNRGIDTLIIAGVTTENCCHATARDAFFRDFQVAFLADATATFDYPDLGHGAMSAAQVHQATLTILAASTADVMTTDDLRARVLASRSQ